MGFSQAEWLEDPVRWYDHIHPEDRERWSVEAAEMFLTGKPLRSAYRVIWRATGACSGSSARQDGARRGRPALVHPWRRIRHHRAQASPRRRSQDEAQPPLGGILDTVGALVVVLSPSGTIIRFNRACEITQRATRSMKCAADSSGTCSPVAGGSRSTAASIWSGAPDRRRARGTRATGSRGTASRRRIAWSSTVLPAPGAAPSYIITTGIDITERKRMETGAARDQRPGAAPDRAGPARRTGPAPDGHRLHEQGAGAAAGREAGRPERTGAEDRSTGEPGDRQDQGAGPRPAAGPLRRPTGSCPRCGSGPAEVEDLFHVSCRFECAEPILITDVGVATHLYHIAQEAVNNAIKHGRPGRIVLSLDREDGRRHPDGRGRRRRASGDSPAQHPGLGLRIMNYRASMIGGTLEVRPRRAAAARWSAAGFRSGLSVRRWHAQWPDATRRSTACSWWTTTPSCGRAWPC